MTKICVFLTMLCISSPSWAAQSINLSLQQIPGSSTSHLKLAYDYGYQSLHFTPYFASHLGAITLSDGALTKSYGLGVGYDFLIESKYTAGVSVKTGGADYYECDLVFGCSETHAITLDMGLRGGLHLTEHFSLLAELDYRYTERRDFQGFQPALGLGFVW